MKRNRLVIVFLIIWVIGAFIYVWGRRDKNSIVQAGKYQDITVAEFDAALLRDPFVVDVHVPEQKHIEGTDKFIDYREVGNRLGDFPQDKNAEILLYCRTGSMSSQAAQVLANAGYTNVKNLVGGTQAYFQAHQGVEISPPSRNLGKVIYGEVAKTEFSLTNNTKDMVNITRVSTSCSCTLAKVEKMTLDPGEAIKVYVSFDPAVHQDDTDLGEVTRLIFIETDQPNFLKLQAEITATVVKTQYGR